MARTQECDKLFRELIGLENSLKNNAGNLNSIFYDLRHLGEGLKNLEANQLTRQKIGLLLDAIGLIVSGGATTAVRRLAGELISTVGSFLGVSVESRKIAEISRQIQNKTFEYDREKTERDYILKKIIDLEKIYATLDCRPKIPRPF